MSEPRKPKAGRPIPALQAAPEPKSITAAAPTPELTEATAPAASVVVALPPPSPRPAPNAAAEMLVGYRGGIAALGESQRALASGIKALALEMTGFAQRNLTAAGDSAAAMIGARNLAEALEIQFGFARRSLEGAVAASARIGEIGAQLVSETSRPIVAPLAVSPRRG